MSANRAPCGPRDRWLAVALAALALALFLPGLFWGLPGGKAIEGAVRILDGEAVYRDFWTMYAPGMFCLTAGVFWFLGREVIAQGAVALLLRAASTGLFLLLLRRLGASRPAAAGVALILGLGFWRPAPEIDSYHPALVLLLLGMLALAAYFREGGRARLLSAGLAAGAASWFKHDVAAYVALAMAASLGLSWWVAGPRRPRGWIPPLKAVGLVALAAVAASLPVALWVARTAGRDAWQDLFVFPATDFARVRGEPFPPILPRLGLLGGWLGDPANLVRGRQAFQHLAAWTLCHLPEGAFAAGVLSLLRARRSARPAALGMAALCLAALPFFWAAAHVQQNTHPYSMALFSLLLGALAWGGLRGARGPAALGRRALLVALGLWAAGLWIPPAMQVFLIAREWPASRLLGLPGTRGVRVSSREHGVYLPIAAFLRAHTREDERIYCGVARHDAVVISDLRFYFLAGRRNCSRYSELHPGVTDREDVGREIIRDLERHRVRAVVLWRFGWPEERLDEILARRKELVPASGSRVLDDHIARNFEEIASYGEYALLWRRGAAGPGRG